MRKGIRNARIVQLAGAASLVLYVVSCSAAVRGESNTVGAEWLLVGLVLIIGAKVYEWMSRE